MPRLLALVLTIPLGLDLYMPVPEDNPLTVEKIALGRRLFFDRRLSRDGTISCATCHDAARAFADPLPRAIGVFGRTGSRNAPALVNRAYGRAFFWDGRTGALEEQVLKPIQDSKEMDLTLEEAAARVGLAVQDISHALASYLRSILSGESAYDRFINGDRSAMSTEAQHGLQIFRGRGNCTACHVGPNLSDERFHNTGVAWIETPDSGLGGRGSQLMAQRSGAKAEGSGDPAGFFDDEGRFAVTGEPRDRGAFKTPTLREVARTAPYMHDGSIVTLEDVVAFYDAGGRANPHLDREIRPLRLTSDEQQALVAFLRSLSGVVREGCARDGGTVAPC